MVTVIGEDNVKEDMVISDSAQATVTRGDNSLKYFRIGYGILTAAAIAILNAFELETYYQVTGVIIILIIFGYLSFWDKKFRNKIIRVAGLIKKREE